MTANQPVPPKLPITGVKHLIAVGSGKGGSARTDSDRADHRGDRTVTPSDVSLEDAREAVHMFHQAKVPILGTVENMSFMNCPHCHNRIDVSAVAAGGERQKRCACIFWWSCRSTPRGASEAIPASLWRCEPFLELARNTVARTNEEAGKSGPTFEVSE